VDADGETFGSEDSMAAQEQETRTWEWKGTRFRAAHARLSRIPSELDDRANFHIEEDDAGRVAIVFADSESGDWEEDRTVSRRASRLVGCELCRRLLDATACRSEETSPVEGIRSNLRGMSMWLGERVYTGMQPDPDLWHHSLPIIAAVVENGVARVEHAGGPMVVSIRSGVIRDSTCFGCLKLRAVRDGILTPPLDDPFERNMLVRYRNVVSPFCAFQLHNPGRSEPGMVETRSDAMPLRPGERLLFLSSWAVSLLGRPGIETEIGELSARISRVASSEDLKLLLAELGRTRESAMEISAAVVEFA